MNRRRFLFIAAAFAASPACATTRWQGRALGAEAEITLAAPADLANAALLEAQSILHDTEHLFSLFQTSSALSRLNRIGTLNIADHRFHKLLDRADDLHRLTQGRFDPTIQPLWQALATGTDPAPARAGIGWSRIQRKGNTVTLGPEQALTLNGIAQGFATDLIAEAFRALGLTETLVNIGEFRALGGPWRIGVSDPIHGPTTTRTLSNTAIATSSPGALKFGGHSHILSPRGHAPHWSTVSVEATTATLADGLSTALCLAKLPTLREIARRSDVHRITAVSEEGDITTI